MKSVNILMYVKFDISGKKIENLSPVGGDISLPKNCVICNETSGGEAPLLLKIKVAEIGEKYNLKQAMPYCKKHLNQLSLIRLMNIIPIITTVWIAIYFFNALGGFGGPGGIGMIVQGFFLASIAGMLTQAFVQGVIIKSFQAGTSGTGVDIYTIMQPEQKNIRKSLLVIFGFQNEVFATQFERLNPPEVYNPPIDALAGYESPMWRKESAPIIEATKKEPKPLPKIIQTEGTELSELETFSGGSTSQINKSEAEPTDIEKIIRQKRKAIEEKNKTLFQKD